MYDFLCHAASFDRIADEIDRHRQNLRPICLHDDGSLTCPWGGVAPKAPSPHIVYANADSFFSPAAGTFFSILMATPQFDWAQIGAAGLEHPALVAIGQKAKAYTASHAASTAIAEWCLWQVFDAFRQGHTRRMDRLETVWKRHESREIQGSRWLIYGFGAIGQDIASRVRALGGHVAGVRRSGGTHPSADQLFTPSGMQPALEAADVVVLSAPHTPDTESMADANFFSRMAKDSIFVNVGRGALVVEDDLLSALETNRPCFAALDVFSVEPLPADHPFWTHSKIALTPHNSAETPGTVARNDQLFLDNLDRFLSGRPLLNLVPQSAFASS